jgi:hypothetical protein
VDAAVAAVVAVWLIDCINKAMSNEAACDHFNIVVIALRGVEVQSKRIQRRLQLLSLRIQREFSHQLFGSTPLQFPASGMPY